MSDPALLSPVEAVLARAVDGLIPGDELCVMTDAFSYAKLTKKPPCVLVAIARPGWAGVLAIDASEYDGQKLLEMAGWEYSPADAPTAMERATSQLDAPKKRR